MTSRWLRVAQGAAIAAFATFVAAISHTVGGGAPPGVLSVALSLAFSALLCITVVGGRLTLSRTVIAVAATQFMLHALYSVQGAVPTASAGGSSHHHLAIDWSSTAESPMSYDASMLFAHLPAVAVTVAAIRQGDRAVRSAIRAIRLAIASVLPRVPRLVGRWLRRPRPAITGMPRPSARLMTLSVMRHRGPPVEFAAA